MIITVSPIIPTISPILTVSPSPIPTVIPAITGLDIVNSVQAFYFNALYVLSISIVIAVSIAGFLIPMVVKMRQEAKYNNKIKELTDLTVQNKKEFGETIVKLNKAVNEANSTTAQLKELAKALTLTSAQSILDSNRVGGSEIRIQLNSLSSLKKIIGDAKIELPELDNIINQVHKVAIWKHYFHFIKALKEKGLYPIANEIEKLQKELDSDFLSIESIKAIFGTDKLEQDLEDILEDYRYYKENLQFRRDEAVKGS